MFFLRTVAVLLLLQIARVRETTEIFVRCVSRLLVDNIACARSVTLRFSTYVRVVTAAPEETFFVRPSTEVGG